MYTPIYEGDGFIRNQKQMSSTKARTNKDGSAPVEANKTKMLAGRRWGILGAIFRIRNRQI